MESNQRRPKKENSFGQRHEGHTEVKEQAMIIFLSR